jgi:hypothetical protein
MLLDFSQFFVGDYTDLGGPATALVHNLLFGAWLLFFARVSRPVHSGC